MEPKIYIFSETKRFISYFENCPVCITIKIAYLMYKLLWYIHGRYFNAKLF